MTSNLPNLPLCKSGEAEVVSSAWRGGSDGGGEGFRCCLWGKDKREWNRGVEVDPDGGAGCLGDVSEMSPDVEEVVALEEVVVAVVVVVVVPRARWSDPAWWWWLWWSSPLAPSLSESVDSPVKGIERIWLARWKNKRFCLVSTLLSGTYSLALTQSQSNWVPNLNNYLTNLTHFQISWLKRLSKLQCFVTYKLIDHWWNLNILRQAWI